MTLNAKQPYFEKMGDHKYITCSIQDMRTTYNCPTTKLATFLFKEKRLSQASLELSSSRGVFGSLENKRKRREKRENQTLTEAARYLHKMKIVSTDCLGLQKLWGFI